MPYEVDALPLTEYRRCRNYVLAKIEADKAAMSEKDESWGDAAVAKAPWSAEVITSLK